MKAGGMVLLPGAAFTALVVLICAGSTVHGTVIPDPQNVMIICKNQTTIVQWDYTDQQPQTMFIVNISGSAGTQEYQTKEHQADLSQFIWKSEDRYMAYHFVTVTAVMGGKKSNSIKTKSFSFNQLKPAYVKCELDFPLVTLTVDESKATVRFQNPFSFYPELKQAHKPTSAYFQFEISASNKTDEAHCRVDQKICKHDFSFPDDVEKCVKLKGWLMEGNEVGHVVFRKRDEVCPSTSMWDHWGFVILMLAVFAVFVIIIIFIVCKVRAWTLKTPPLPETLFPPESNFRSPERYPALDSNAVMSHVQVVDIRASFDSMEEEEVSPTAGLREGSSSSGPGPQNPPRDPFYMESWLSDSSSSQEAMGLMSEGQTTDDDSANSSVETVCVSMNSTEGEGEGEARSPYDRPHIPQIDMGDGDIVMVYTGR